jgi:hypothetical protein
VAQTSITTVWLADIDEISRVVAPPAGHLEGGLRLVASSVRRDPANPLAGANEYPWNQATAGTENADGDIAGQLYAIVGPAKSDLLPDCIHGTDGAQQCHSQRAGTVCLILAHAELSGCYVGHMELSRETR